MKIIILPIPDFPLFYYMQGENMCTEPGVTVMNKSLKYMYMIGAKT